MSLPAGLRAQLPFHDAVVALPSLLRCSGCLTGQTKTHLYLPTNKQTTPLHASESDSISPCVASQPSVPTGPYCKASCGLAGVWLPRLPPPSPPSGCFSLQRGRDGEFALELQGLMSLLETLLTSGKRFSVLT